MLIGIDLDNTIINYEYAFKEGLKYLNINFVENLSSKKEIRDYLRRINNGEIHWQKLQGLVYGKLLNQHARLYDGFYRFLWRSSLAGNEIRIISHKTEFGHFDEEKIPLREEALKFLESNSILHTKLVEQVIFKNTFQEKIDEIKNSSFSVFIDDLDEVISNIPDAISSKYLFSDGWENNTLESKNWLQIDSEINGSWKVNEVIQLANEVIGNEPKNVDQIKRSGNSGVYKLSFEQELSLKLKIYSFEINQKRLNTEFDSLALLRSVGVQNIPKPIFKNEDLGVAFYEWIEGEKIIEPSEKDIDSCLKFIQKINHSKDKLVLNGHDVPNASAACFCALDIENQVEKRLNSYDIPRKNNLELNLFLSQEFYPVWKKILYYVKTNWQSLIGFHESILQKDKILSPSDFGFHNALQDESGKIHFLDFEYFGWDDPVKLASDFYIHPGMNLSENLGEYWVNNFFELFGHENLKRFQLLKFLYWMIWPLITLNDYRDDVWLRRSLSLNIGIDRQEILILQLNKSRDLLVRINHIFKIELENYGSR